MDQIVVSGAREHNLKDVDVAIPRDSLTVITGLSGSGKSSLAFDTIYAEGQRRYVESLSAYARQFLGQMDKPDVDSIEGLSPAISIDQKTTSRNPRSTVGTVTEIYDYLRLLWARIGHPHCHICGRPITGQSAEQIIDQVMELAEGTRFMVMAPIVRGRKGEYGKQFEELRTEGFGRVKVNGELRRLDEEIVLDKKYKHDISVVVDRLVMKTDLRKRLADSVETAVTLADGLVEIEMVDAPARTPVARTSGSSRSPSGSRVRCTGRAWSSSSRGSSRSTRRTGPARGAPAWARRWRSTRSWSSRTRRCRSGRERSRRGRQARRTTTTSSRSRSPSATTSTWRRRGRTFRTRRATSSCTGPRASASRSRIATGSAVAARTRRSSRGSSPTSSAATARPTPTTRGRRSRST